MNDLAPGSARVGIIGCGHVGGSVARALLQAGVVRELHLHDKDEARAEGEVLDLVHASPYLPRCELRPASLAEACDAAVVVVAAGRSSRPGESRRDLLRDNLALVETLGVELRGARGVVLMVSNPVDVLTQRLQQCSELPPARVLGTGTVLDSARLRTTIAEELACDVRSVQASVVGEHGDSQVALWSSVTVGGVALRRWPGWRREREPELERGVVGAAPRIVRSKGATWHAIGLVTADIASAILRDERRVLSVSRVQEGAAGVEGVALSLPALVGAGGTELVLEPDMDAEERRRLHESAEGLRPDQSSRK